VPLPTTPPTTVNEFSNAVADYLEEYGHNQNGHWFGKVPDGKDHPSACAVGAQNQLWEIWGIRVGTPLAQIYSDWGRALRAHPEVQRLGGNRARWSDNTPTPEVIATLRRLS
jgi:hypothetical protein